MHAEHTIVYSECTLCQNTLGAYSEHKIIYSINTYSECMQSIPLYAQSTHYVRIHSEHIQSTRSYILFRPTLNACRACHCILRVYSRHTQREYSGILELYSECTLVYSEFPKHFLKGFWVYIGTLHQSILRVCSEYALSKLRRTVRML